jgi:hypothetical protein
MKTIRIVLLLITCLAILLLFAGCNFNADDGTITGVVFYSDDETVVPDPWVAIYSAGAPDVIYTLVHGDEIGRYAANVPEGDYMALASTNQSGPFTGDGNAFGVVGMSTTVKKIVIDEAPGEG